MSEQALTEQLLEGASGQARSHSSWSLLGWFCVFKFEIFGSLELIVILDVSGFVKLPFCSLHPFSPTATTPREGPFPGALLGCRGCLSKG